jgi:uncharacterized membrane protein
MSRDRWLLAAILAGLALRFTHLGATPLWLDEVTTANWVARPWREMLALCLADNHPPLYFMLIKAVRELLGDAPWALRLPSALVGAAAIPCVAAAAVTLAGRRAGRWAAWFAALSPYLIHHAQETRMYALVGTLAAANLVALARFTTGRTARLGALFTVTSVGLAATHYYTVFYLTGAVLAAVGTRPRDLRGWLPAAAVASAAAFGALLAMELLARHQAAWTYQLGWLGIPGALWSLVAGYSLLPDTLTLHAEGSRAALRYLPVAIAATPVLAACVLLGLGSLDRRSRVTLVLPIASAFLAPFAVPHLVPGVAVNPRYFQPIVPAVLVVLGIGAAARTSWSSLARGAGVAIAVVLAGATVLHLAEPGRGREDTSAAEAWLDAHVPTAQPLLVTSPEMATLARFHWAGRPIVDYPAPGTVVGAVSAADLAQHLPWRDGRAVYVFGRAWVSDPDGALERDVQQRFASCGEFETRGIRIYCLKQASTAEARAGGDG